MKTPRAGHTDFGMGGGTRVRLGGLARDSQQDKRDKKMNLNYVFCSPRQQCNELDIKPGKDMFLFIFIKIKTSSAGSATLEDTS